MKIFVQIISYRDKELVNTIKSLLSKAKNPDSIRIGVFFQSCEEDNISLDEIKSDNRIKIIEESYKNSLGESWARSKAQSLYDNEEYTLQIDSHHVFAKNWDIDLIKMLEDTKSENPIISSYPNSYRIKDEKIELLGLEPLEIEISSINENKEISFLSYPIKDFNKLKTPIKGKYVCNNFIFARGDYCKNYKHDPQIYGKNSDLVSSLRLFTMGYEVFHPNKNVIWHKYNDKNKKTKYQKDRETNEQIKKSQKRIESLIKNELEEYGLGNEKNLNEFYEFTGLDIINLKVNNKEEITNLTVEPTRYKLDIEFDFEEIDKADDYDFWFLGLHDEKGNEIIRRDLKTSDYKDVLDLKENKVTMSLYLTEEANPKTCVLWPHSVSKGWLNRIEVKIEK